MNRAFLDSNIVVYFYTLTEPLKREAVGELLLENQDFVISTQVLSETCNVLRRKFGWEWTDIRPIIQELRRVFQLIRVDENTIERAMNIAESTNIPYFDSVMVASAADAGCTVLYSEDFQDGQRIEGVKVVNPFIRRA
jgi:predicted nucleic acid-binding protein